MQQHPELIFDTLGNNEKSVFALGKKDNSN